MFNITGKKAIITGGGNGIGLSLVRAFHKAGVEIAVLDIDENIKELPNLFPSEPSLHVFQTDLLDSHSLRQGYEAALEKLNGEMDILINSAGLIQRHPAEDFPIDMWDKIMGVNVRAVFELSRLAAASMKKNKGGKIINFGSIVSIIGAYNSSAYSASKGAVMQLTKSLSNEWAQYNIQVNAIAPGYMLTTMNDDLMKDAVRKKQVEDRIPAKRWGTPEDIEGVALFLSSQASDYITGTLIPVDGGVLGR
ncbi:SDR family oxidoreductase [Alkalicoccus saliphilus]|uniref:2-deoxy-D-gluconate 3-dehydrogenase n=1 Tax=Alkalicoccus saliphilus TaxID=200989 RepID=A0A2T4U4T4_9BACI|nr:SDR family oxidoreductase [Alkalicoccus saliphilus]PTL38365.1 2-deoxy-D-gluconate 3-dehydrogenase [Alkalicoccus saliphilus]